MPALIESIKERGLVLIADTSDETSDHTQESTAFAAMGRAGGAAHWTYRMPMGVNGVMRGTGVLRFNDTIDM